MFSRNGRNFHAHVLLLQLDQSGRGYVRGSGEISPAGFRRIAFLQGAVGVSRGGAAHGRAGHVHNEPSTRVALLCFLFPSCFPPSPFPLFIFATHHWYFSVLTILIWIFRIFDNIKCCVYIDWLVDWLHCFCWLIDWLILWSDWLIDWLIMLIVLIDWLIDL